MFWGTVVIILLVAGCSSAGPADEAAVRLVKGVRERVKPLHARFGKPKPGDWVLSHEEKGQTFEEYVAFDPPVPTAKRRVIVVQPLGTFSEKQREVVTLTAEFMGLYYGLPVRIEKDLPLDLVPGKARRTHPTWGDRQILSTWVLDDLLLPRRPKDAAAYIAFTASDLWPGKGWNFVFGQASLHRRVGVWSIYRNGDPAKDAAAFRLCLMRTMKTGTHELGHIFGIHHCIAYDCGMCGSNSREESDRRPVRLGPECLAKVCWGLRLDPAARLTRLRDFYAKHGFEDEAAFMQKSIDALK